MKIEVFSPTIRRKEMDAVLTVMVEEKIGPGERGRFLIQIARENLRFDYALCLRSPAIALYLALKALNLEPGQAVALSALSPRYYLRVLEDLGLRPLYCDVSMSFPCMNRETIEQAIKDKAMGMDLRCILLNHTLGFIPDTASISELGLPVIEDISQSCNVSSGEEAAESKDRVNGVFTILGLEERDILTSGGGALLFASNRRDSSILRNFAELPPEYCLPDINSAMAVIQFKEFRRNMEKRKEIARVFMQASLQSHHKRFVPLEKWEYNNYAFPIVLESGLKDVITYANKKDIVVESAFSQSLAGRADGNTLNCPAAYSLSLRTALFPLYPRLRSGEIERISKLIMTLP